MKEPFVCPSEDWGSALAKPQSTLYINEGLQISFTKRKPLWWWRMWQWVFLGWKWTNL